MNKIMPFSLKEMILEQFFPVACPFCGRVVSYRVLCCPTCLEKLRFIDTTHHCSRCANDPCVCGEQDYSLDGLAAALEYTETVSEAVVNYKYHGHRNYSRFFAYLLECAVDKRFAGMAFDAVVYVPMAPKQQRKRGYNQAELLAVSLGKHLEAPLCHDVLRKNTKANMQHLLRAEERVENAKNSYFAGKEEITGKRILLCDDVATTRATLNVCAKILKEQGAKSVYGAVIAATQAKKIENDANIIYNKERADENLIG